MIRRTTYSSVISPFGGSVPSGNYERREENLRVWVTWKESGKWLTCEYGGGAWEESAMSWKNGGK